MAAMVAAASQSVTIARGRALKADVCDSTAVGSQSQNVVCLNARHAFFGYSTKLSRRTINRTKKIVNRQVFQVVNKTEQQEIADEIKAFRELERRWQAQVSEGKVKSLSQKEAGYAVKLTGHVLLDVRPTSERQRSWVKGSLHIPAFDTPKGFDITTAFKSFSNFALGGWWSGSGLTKVNERFMPDVVAQIPKSANVVVACQKGLRSLAVCEQMYKAGYRNLFWINGGFDGAEEGDFDREGPQPLKFAGIGGVSEFVGWTDAQRAEARKAGIGYRLFFFARLMFAVIAVDALVFGFQQLFTYLQTSQGS